VSQKCYRGAQVIPSMPWRDAATLERSIGLAFFAAAHIASPDARHMLTRARSAISSEVARRPPFDALQAFCQALDLTLDDVIVFSEARYRDHA
jgi:hypothetical protein